MARKTAYLVFLLPVIISVPVAAYVLMDILEQPDRELDMWPIGSGTGHGISDLVNMYVFNFNIYDNYLDNKQTNYKLVSNMK